MNAYLRRQRQKEDEKILKQMLSEKKSAYEKDKKREIEELNHKLKQLKL